jgi:hypothetical protein
MKVLAEVRRVEARAGRIGGREAVHVADVNHMAIHVLVFLRRIEQIIETFARTAHVVDLTTDG